MALPPVDVVELFPDLQCAFMELLSGLTSEEWNRPTVCGDWTVKDLVQHMLGSHIGMISSWRDDYHNPHFADGLDISTGNGLLAAINRQNANWVAATQRISPRLLVELFRTIGDEFVVTTSTVDLMELSGPVDWAGPDPAPAWMQLAREYTEYWIHQQHIRDAVGKPGLTDRRMYFPVLDAFARAMPHNLHNSSAAEGAVVRLVITGEAGGTWSARRANNRWDLIAEGAPAVATVTLDQDLAWRLFTKGVRPAEAIERIDVCGKHGLARPIIEMVTILA
ncbi:MAG TPA: maleylpyruvate isomerase family mycothiol-dependent enzyme [Thermomicrobiales bacterium]|nr:maleylpyruvate isomerase family mycothiol-dependent enzyme [Thermomicrobiales bacterium]